MDRPRRAPRRSAAVDGNAPSPHLPAAVVPVGVSPEGLPIGVQVMGGPFDEEQVLAVAAAIERESGGYRRTPIS